MLTTVKCRQAGFTLIELSIVLVIIGLVLGGILVGQDLITAGKMRLFIKQREMFDTAVMTFTSKYNCLPGDCPNAVQAGVGVASGAPEYYGDNGNGNGIVNGGFENNSFWYHLSQAQLINWAAPSSYTNQPCVGSPCLSIDNGGTAGQKAGWWVQSVPDNATVGEVMADPTIPSGHYWWLTAFTGSGSDGSATLTPNQARNIDMKIDDGLPMTGMTRAAHDDNEDPYGPKYPYIGAGGATSDACVSNSVTPYVYNALNSNRTNANLCSLIIRSVF